MSDPRTSFTRGLNKMFQTLGQGYVAYKQRLDELTAQDEFDVAQLQMLKATNDFEFGLETDPDYKGYEEKLESFLTTTHTNITDNMTSQRAKNQFTNIWKQNSEKLRADTVLKALRKGQLVKRVNTVDLLDDLLLTRPQPREESQIPLVERNRLPEPLGYYKTVQNNRIKQIVAGAYSVGAFSKEEAQALVEEYSERYDSQAVVWQMDTMPAMDAYEWIQSKENTPDIDDETRDALTKRALGRWNAETRLTDAQKEQAALDDYARFKSDKNGAGVPVTYGEAVAKYPGLKNNVSYLNMLDNFYNATDGEAARQRTAAKAEAELARTQVIRDIRNDVDASTSPEQLDAIDTAINGMNTQQITLSEEENLEKRIAAQRKRLAGESLTAEEQQDENEDDYFSRIRDATKISQLDEIELDRDAESVKDLTGPAKGRVRKEIERKQKELRETTKWLEYTDPATIGGFYTRFWQYVDAPSIEQWKDGMIAFIADHNKLLYENPDGTGDIVGAGGIPFEGANNGDSLHDMVLQRYNDIKNGKDDPLQAKLANEANQYLDQFVNNMVTYHRDKGNPEKGFPFQQFGMQTAVGLAEFMRSDEYLGLKTFDAQENAVYTYMNRRLVSANLPKSMADDLFIRENYSDLVDKYVRGRLTTRELSTAGVNTYTMHMKESNKLVGMLDKGIAEGGIDEFNLAAKYDSRTKQLYLFDKTHKKVWWYDDRKPVIGRRGNAWYVQDYTEKKIEGVGTELIYNATDDHAQWETP